MKIAVVHDYFTQRGGAEKVAEELFNMLPTADLFSLATVKNCLPESLRELDVHTSWLQTMPGMAKYYRLYFMLYPFAVSSLNLSPYDLIVSSSSGYAKGIFTNSDAMHVCYCHTPMRWAWDMEKYCHREAMSASLKMVLLKLSSVMRDWDIVAARQPDHFIANSRTVADRIRSSYGRYAEIINPPIDVDRFHMTDERDDYYVVLSRLAAYKRIDLAVKACTLLKRKLLVIGTGPHHDALAAEAGPTVTLCGRLSDEEVDHHVSRCRALIFPGEEDFGMAPLEVAAAGRPCIAYRAGGATETIIDGITGTFFDKQETEDLVAAIEAFEKQSWSPTSLRKHAEGFSTSVFQERMREFLAKVGVPAPALSLVLNRDTIGSSTGCAIPSASLGWN
jgi:glycosyltransferase involved in cell wall biosynthesis